MISENETALAWALVDVAMPRLDNAAKTRTCAQIGAGEPRAAIQSLLRLLAADQLVLPFETAGRLTSWLHGFRGSDSEEPLRRLVDQIPVAMIDGGRRLGLWVR